MQQAWTAREVCRIAGCTYRQLDYWIRTGLIFPAVQADGSGTRRQFSYDEVRIAVAVTLLRDSGIALIDRDIAERMAALEGSWSGHTLELTRNGPVCVLVDLGWVEKEMAARLAGAR